MQIDDQYSSIDNGICSEDIGRRSACDRCRKMKTRCERPHHRNMSHMQQCRRCRQAHVSCTTTLEAQPGQNGSPDGTDGRQRKRTQVTSYGLDGMTGEPFSSSSTSPPLSDLTPNPTYLYNVLADSVFDREVLTSQDTAHQWLGEDASHEGLVDSLSVGEIIRGAPFTGGASRPGLQSVDGVDSVTQVSQGSLDSPLHTSIPPIASQSSNKTVMSELMELNNELSRDVQAVADTDRSWSDTGSILSETLRHSALFIEILRSLNSGSSGDESSRSCFRRGEGIPEKVSNNSDSTDYINDDRHNRSSNGRIEKVDINIALQLLSCNMNICSMYKRLHVELTTAQNDIWRLRSDQQALRALGLEGMLGFDVEVRSQILVYSCSLIFARVQAELEAIRQRGVLTCAADRTFQSVLGVAKDDVFLPVIGIETVSHDFRKLLLAREILH